MSVGKRLISDFKMTFKTKILTACCAIHNSNVLLFVAVGVDGVVVDSVVIDAVDVDGVVVDGVVIVVDVGVDIVDVIVIVAH